MKSVLTAVLLSSLLITNAALTSHCEETKRERVVSLSKRVGQVLDRQESRRFGLYKDIPSFVKATYLQELDSGRYFAEITLKENGEIIERRIEVSPIMLKVWSNYITNYEKIQLERRRERLRMMQEHLIHGAIFAMVTSFIAVNIIGSSPEFVLDLW